MYIGELRMKTQELAVQGVGIRITKVDGMDFVCLTDIAKQKNPAFPGSVPEKQDFFIQLSFMTSTPSTIARESEAG